nr:electron transfer flavoprotein subunit alpha/FixB family protein [Corynebacterium aquatimens]
MVERAAGSGSGLSPVTAELITAARPLGVVSAVVVGAPGEASSLAQELGALGAAQVIDASAEDYSARVITPEVDALHALGSANPAPIVVAATTTGNEIAGRLGARLGSGVLANVSAINADRSAAHQIFGGSYTTTAVAGGPCPIYTVRPGAVKAEPQPADAQLAPMPLPGASARDVTVTGFTPKTPADRPDLASASVVVSGGRGVGSAEGYRDYVEGLADELGAAVGSTRDIVYDGWAAPETQVGQTGATVSPDLYIALGISGAIQHTSGMQTSGTIVAVNQDGDEPIFDIADIAAVGDVEDIVPELISQLQARKG